MEMAIEFAILGCERILRRDFLATDLTGVVIQMIFLAWQFVRGRRSL